MTELEWQQVWDIFHAARNVEASNIAAFLASADASSKVLTEVRALLDDAAQAPPARLNDPEVRVGRRFGHYEISAFLDRGGMGQIYSARDLELDRMVALKFLPQRAVRDGARIDELVREAKAASALNHPNIVTVYEVIRAGDEVAIAMELVEGEPLRSYSAEGQPVERVAQWGSQIAQALAAAHQRKIIHRDIKPENLMVRGDGIVKVLDFGLSARTDVESPSPGTGSPLGTLMYMSPEQARGEVATSASDVFSLGIVLYELATGQHPFRSDSPFDTAQAIANRKEVSPALSASPALDALLARMLAHVPSERPQAPEIAATLSDVGSPVRGNGVSRRGIAIAAAVLLPVIAGSGWWIARSRPTVPEVAFNLAPLTTFSGVKNFASFSPDGERIAFSWDGGKTGENLRIYIMPANGGAPQRLQINASNSDDAFPAWSPDGSLIAFVRRTPGAPPSICLVAASGGVVRTVWDKAGNGVSWSPDGTALVVTGQRAVDGTRALVLLTLETGVARELTKPDSGSDGFGMYSPDSKWIAFSRAERMSEIFVMPASGGPPRQLTFDGKPKIRQLTWTADSREIVYSMEREFGGAGLWRVPIAEGEPRPLAGLLQFAGNPNISRSGDRLIYTDTWRDTNIYRSESAGFSSTGTLAPFGPWQKVIASSREDHTPSYSGDDASIAYVSNRSSHSEVWTAGRDGNGEAQLTQFQGFAGTPRWSPDGQTIAFDLRTFGSNIWVIPAKGGTARQLTTGNEDAMMPSWSPDGAWIYYGSNRSGEMQIWKMTADGRDQTQLTRGGGEQARAGRDGKTVYYTKRGVESDLWQIELQGPNARMERPVPGMEKYNRIGRAWGVLAQGIYFSSREDAGQEDTIRFLNFATGQVTSLGVTGERAYVGEIAISSDGRELLTVRTDQRLNDLMLINNFR